MSESKREALAKDLLAVWWNKLEWVRVSDDTRNACLALADFILAREAEREGLLVEALEKIDRTGPFHCADREFVDEALRVSATALAAYRALDAPPQRTLAEVAKDVLYKWDDRQIVGVDGKLLAPLMCELAEALKREEGK